MVRGRSTVRGFGGGFTGFGPRRSSKVRCGSISFANSANRAEDVDKASPRLDLDQAEMVEQLQRWRHRLASDAVIQPEVDIAHARTAAVTDGSLDRCEHAPRTPGQRGIGW
jgi:hypothetical protein